MKGRATNTNMTHTQLVIIQVVEVTLEDLLVVHRQEEEQATETEEMTEALLDVERATAIEETAET